MSEIVFLTLDGGGNVSPVVPIARELVGRGHRVRVMGAPAQQEPLAAEGLNVTAYRAARGWSPRTATGPSGAVGFARLLSDRGYADDLAELVRQRPADVVVMDALMPASIAAATADGLPVAVLMHTFAQFFLRNPALNGLAAAQGVRPARAWSSARRVVVAADPSLDPASRRTASTNLEWTGVAEPPPSLTTDAPAKPARVLVSLSTVAAPGQARVLQRILDAVAYLPVSVIVTVGPAIARTELRPGVNTELVETVPHGEILPTVAAVVGHGGHSTTMRALMHGKPMVIIPCDTRIDQPMVGAAVERAGAGIQLSKGASISAISHALHGILGSDRYRQAAERVGARLREADGVGAAADAILDAR